ncbi:No apical meristem-associated C-terminal domain-containing protein [Plasmodiophora brassicae]
MSAPPDPSIVEASTTVPNDLFNVPGAYSYKDCQQLAQGGAPTHKRFAAWHDVLLLRATNDIKPWEAKYGKVMAVWDLIGARLANIIGFGLKKDGPSLKKRFELIVDQFRKDDQEALKKSGVEEEFAEKQELLTDIVTRMDDYLTMTAAAKAELTGKKEAVEASGAIMRELAMREMGYESLDDDENIGGTVLNGEVSGENLTNASSDTAMEIASPSPLQPNRMKRTGDFRRKISKRQKLDAFSDAIAAGVSQSNQAQSAKLQLMQQRLAFDMDHARRLLEFEERQRLRDEEREERQCRRWSSAACPVTARDTKNSI